MITNQLCFDRKVNGTAVIQYTVSFARFQPDVSLAAMVDARATTAQYTGIPSLYRTPRVSTTNHTNANKTQPGPCTAQKPYHVLLDIAHRITKFPESIDIGFVWRTQDTPLALHAKFDPQNVCV